LANAVCHAGLDVIAADLVGHGKSPGRRGHIVDFATDHLSAVDELVAAADELGFTAPRFLLGHSLGGLIAARWVQTRGASIAGLVLMTPFVAARADVPAWKRLLATVLSRPLPAFSLETGIQDSDLFRDPVEQQAYGADPLVQRVISAGHWIAIGAEQRRLLIEADRLTLPTLLLLAGEDRIVSTDAARELGESLPDVTVIEYAEAFHALHADPDSGSVFSDVVEWMRQQAAA
jgi:lysophospholipase